MKDFEKLIEDLQEFREMLQSDYEVLHRTPTATLLKNYEIIKNYLDDINSILKDYE